MSANKFRYDTEDVEKLAMANCMMILDRARVSDSGRIFKCKTCNRTFASFQALGGHTASHKRPKFVDGNSGLVRVSKTHQCSICKHEFYTGQALGGHMRRHRGENKAESMEMASNCLSSSESERGVLPDLKKTIIEKRSLSSIESEIEEPDLKKTIIEKKILSSSDMEIGESDLKKTIVEKRILSSSDMEIGEPDLKKTIIEKRILSSSTELEIGEPDLKKTIRLFGIDLNLIPEEDDFDVDTKTKMFFV